MYTVTVTVINIMQIAGLQDIPDVEAKSWMKMVIIIDAILRNIILILATLPRMKGDDISQDLWFQTTLILVTMLDISRDLWFQTTLISVTMLDISRDLHLSYIKVKVVNRQSIIVMMVTAS